jgi:outer membrane lipoprotein SlyB
MAHKSIWILIVTSMTGVSICGCSSEIVQTASGPMPQYCTQNNTATGAVIGALLGAGIGAAAGGGRGAAIGAAAGAGLGGLTGAQADAQCHQIAMQNFMQLMAQQAEAQRVAATQGQMAQIQPSAYQSVEYYTPAAQQGHPPVRHKITQTNSYTNPATKETCGAFSNISFGDDNKGSVTSTGRICTGADGKPHEA